MTRFWLTMTFAIAGAVPLFAQAEQSLPITRVVLFRSGVGYIERGGSVDGHATMTLSFRENQINDLLKSMVLQDLDGGKILPISYTSKDPMARTLSSFAINLADNPSRAELFRRLRGVSVEITGGARVLKGRVLGVETKQVIEPTSKMAMTLEFVNLATATGIETFAIDQIALFTIQDARLQREFEQALETLASGLDNTRKTVQLQFQGDGKRRVRVGYVIEMPVWKMSYRLVLSETRRPFLQGWAIVENTSEEDWKNVRIGLVAGQPVSFIQELYQPLYAPRPRLQSRLYSMLMPQLYGGALEEQDKQLARVGEKLDAGGGVSSGRGRRPGGEAAGIGGSPAAPEMKAGIDFADLGESVGAMAQGAELGALFEYQIDQPVSIARQQSAMLPIVNEAVEGEQISVYNPSVNPKHPMYGLRMTNSTDLTLLEGPLTIYVEDSYGGDAVIETIEPGGNRILTYALDLEVEATMDVPEPQQSLSALKIVRGVLHETRKLRQEHLYTIRNRNTKSRTLLIEHPFNAVWKLLEPKEPTERTADRYRFRVQVPADKTEKLRVIEEQPVQQTIALLQADMDSLQLYLKNPVASTEMKNTLQAIINRRNAIGELEYGVNRRKERITAIREDQARIRENMSRLDKNSELYQRYVKTLNQQEDELVRLDEEITDLQKQINTKRAELATYLEQLSVE